MAYLGAQYIQTKARPRMKDETDESYAKVPLVTGIFIPDKFNDISVQEDTRKEGSRNKNGLTARASMNMFGMGRNDEKLLDSIRVRLVQDGKTPDEYNTPSHKVNASFREEFVKATRQRIQNRLLAQHPEWNGTTEENNPDLRRAITMEIPSQLGLVYLNRPRDPQPQQQVAPVYTAETYTQPAPQVADMAPQGETACDDLPF